MNASTSSSLTIGKLILESKHDIHDILSRSEAIRPSSLDTVHDFTASELRMFFGFQLLKLLIDHYY